MIDVINLIGFLVSWKYVWIIGIAAVITFLYKLENFLRLPLSGGSFYNGEKDGAVFSVAALLAGCGDSGSASGAPGQNSGAQESETVP